MSDIPTLANGGAPASPAPAPQATPAPASTAPPSPKPSAPPNPRSTGYSPARDRYEQIRHAQDQARGLVLAKPSRSAGRRQDPWLREHEFRTAAFCPGSGGRQTQLAVTLTRSNLGAIERQ